MAAHLGSHSATSPPVQPLQEPGPSHQRLPPASQLFRSSPSIPAAWPCFGTRVRRSPSVPRPAIQPLFPTATIALRHPPAPSPSISTAALPLAHRRPAESPPTCGLLTTERAPMQNSQLTIFTLSQAQSR